MQNIHMRSEVIDFTQDIKLDIRGLLRATGDNAYFRVDDIVQKFEGKQLPHFFDEATNKDRHEYRRVALEYKNKVQLGIPMPTTKPPETNALEDDKVDIGILTRTIEKPFDDIAKMV